VRERKVRKEKEKTKKYVFLLHTCDRQTMECLGAPSEWELREIKGIRLLKSANAFKCHKAEAYTGQPGDILFLLFVDSIIKFNVQVDSTFEIFDLRYSNFIVAWVKILWISTAECERTVLYIKWRKHQSLTFHMFYLGIKACMVYKNSIIISLF